MSALFVLMYALVDLAYSQSKGDNATSVDLHLYPTAHMDGFLAQFRVTQVLECFTYLIIVSILMIDGNVTTI